MLVAQKHRRQGKKERAGEQQLDDLEHAADRLVADGAQHDVGDREQHHRHEEQARGRAADGSDDVTPALQFQKFFEVFACLSESWRIIV